MKAWKLCIPAAVLGIILTGCGECKHPEWKDATYDEPKTCVECGATEGEPRSYIDDLSTDEKRAFDAITAYFSNGEIMVTTWYKIIETENQNALGGFQISKNGSRDWYSYNVNTQKLELIEDDMLDFMLFAFGEEDVFANQNSTVINRINFALAEYYQ